MDRGTDCRDVLLGKTLRLKNGWVAVVNRGQAALNSKVRREGSLWWHSGWVDPLGCNLVAVGGW